MHLGGMSTYFPVPLSESPVIECSEAEGNVLFLLSFPERKGILNTFSKQKNHQNFPSFTTAMHKHPHPTPSLAIRDL